MLYFAYGSNMLTERLQARVPSARPRSTAILPDHGLRWHKRSTDNSGKCDIIQCPGETVHGVLFEMDEAQLGSLDIAEGLGHGYHHQTVAVTLPDYSTVKALAYAAEQTHIEPTLKPYDWYHALVLAGARQHSLSADYIAGIRSVQTAVDPDQNREARLEALALCAPLAKSGD